MVLKRTNCVTNSGNTMRTKYFNSCLRPARTTASCIIKSSFNFHIQPVDFHEQNVDILKRSAKYVNDGDIELQAFDRSPVIYGLNKRKRWLIPHGLSEIISSEDGLQDEDFKFSLAEYMEADCTAYHDSQYCKSVHSTKHSFLSDLRDVARGQEKQTKPSRRKPYHNMHNRGIQRRKKEKVNSMKKSNHPMKRFYQRQRLLGHPEPRGLPEIRYEVIHEKLKFCSNEEFRPWKWNNLRGCKAKKKVKGARNSAREYLGCGYIEADLQEGLRYWRSTVTDAGTTEQEEIDRNSCNISEDQLGEICFPSVEEQETETFEVEETIHNWVHISAVRYRLQETNDSWISIDAFEDDLEHWLATDESKIRKRETYEIDLERLIERNNKRTFRKHTQSKRRRQNIKSSRNENPLMFDDFETNQNVSVRCINPASSQLTRKYGKGHGIVGNSREDGQIKTEKDADIPQVPDTSSQIQRSLVSTNEVWSFNASFSECLTSVHELQPQNLKAKYGSKIIIGQVEPFTFVFDLGQGYFLLCQLYPEQPDFKSQTKHIRMILQGPGTADVLKSANMYMSRSLGDTSGHSWSLAEVIDVAKLAIKMEVSTDSSQMEVARSYEVRNVINDWLFTELIVVKTAEEILREEHLPAMFQMLCAGSDENEMDHEPVKAATECTVCFSSFNEGKHCSLSEMKVTLLSCKHSFCHECWQRHLCQNIQQGKTTLQCMEYDCAVEVDFATVASLVPAPLFTRWQHQRNESYITKLGCWHWCPRPGCNSLAKLVDTRKSARLGQYGIPVHCRCGEKWCLLCNKAPHWPALCSQYASYWKMLLQNGDENGQHRNDIVSVYYANVKKCPSCKHPMEKNGGCSHMTCHCSHNFCWECLGTWSSHMANGLECQRVEEKTVKITMFRHVASPLRFYKESVEHRLAWKQLTPPVIARKVGFLVQYQKKEARNSQQQMNATEAESREKFMRDLLQYVQDVHILLENCDVLRSHITRRCHCKNFCMICSQINLLLSRIEWTLRAVANQRDKQTGRLYSLQQSACALIQQLVNITPSTQAVIEKYGRKQTTGSHTEGE